MAPECRFWARIYYATDLSSNLSRSNKFIMYLFIYIFIYVLFFRRHAYSESENIIGGVEPIYHVDDWKASRWSDSKLLGIYRNWGIELYSCPLGWSSPVYREENSQESWRRINFLKELLIFIDWRHFMLYLKSRLSLIGIVCPEGYFKIFESVSGICVRNCHDSLAKSDVDKDVRILLTHWSRCSPWRLHCTVWKALAYVTLERCEASVDSLSYCDSSYLIWTYNLKN